jgi:hypothetical protein
MDRLADWLYHDAQTDQRRLKRRARWAVWGAAIGFVVGFAASRLLA